MDYEEAIHETFSQAEAVTEIVNHNLEPCDFFAEVGKKSEYTGLEILNWLEY